MSVLAMFCNIKMKFSADQLSLVNRKSFIDTWHHLSANKFYSFYFACNTLSISYCVLIQFIAYISTEFKCDLWWQIAKTVFHTYRRIDIHWCTFFMVCPQRDAYFIFYAMNDISYMWFLRGFYNPIWHMNFRE